jgi:integrase
MNLSNLVNQRGKIMSISHKKLEAMYGKPYTGVSEIKDDDSSLYARISPKGKITFQIKNVINGKLARYKIGSFPEMSLKQARQKADEDKEWIDKGQDPRSRGLLSSGFKPLTVAEAISYWYENNAIKNRKDPKSTIDAFNSLIPKAWLKINIEHMSAVDWGNLYKGVAKINSGGYGLTCISELRTVMRYCISEGVAVRSDYETLKPSNYCERYAPKDRALDPRELGLILRELPNTSLEERNEIVVRLSMVFGCRVNELALAKRSHFDLDQRLWTVPKENLKGGTMRGSKITKALRRPIPKKIVPYIERLFVIGANKEYLLTNRGSRFEPIGSSSLSKISGSLVNELGMKLWTMHDFRRTIATRLTDMGCPPHVTEKLLGHVMRGTMAVYNRSEMLPDLDHWLTIWVDKLEQWQVNDENVVELSQLKA